MDTRRGCAGLRRSDRPSMEPRPFSHGYQMGLGSSSPPASGPSMEPRPFSHGYGPRSDRTAWPRCTFNGATTFQPWIHVIENVPTAPPIRLQWSHDLSAMDTRRAIPGCCRRSPPSMEPRPFSHGYAAQEAKLDRYPDLQWSHDLSAMDTGRLSRRHRVSDPPSMEPRPFSHGYVPESDDR